MVKLERGREVRNNVLPIFANGEISNATSPVSRTLDALVMGYVGPGFLPSLRKGEMM